jgi:hypothetical protein
MKGKYSRRDLLRRFSGLAPAVGLAAVSVPALTPSPASASTSTGLTTIAGTWETLVTFPGNPGTPAEHGLTAFTPDGIVTAMSGSNVTGFGTWKPTGEKTFALDFRHLLFDSGGNVTGEVRVSQQGTVTSPNQYTAAGTGAAYDLNGNLLGSNQNQTSGTRYGFTV